MSLDIEELEKAGKAAPSEPWFAAEGSGFNVRQRDHSGMSHSLCQVRAFDKHREIADFIVLARNNWQAIIDALRENESLSKECGTAMDAVNRQIAIIQDLREENTKLKWDNERLRKALACRDVEQSPPIIEALREAERLRALVSELETSNERLKHAASIWERNSADATQDWERLRIAKRRLEEIANDEACQPVLHAAAGLREMADVVNYADKK